MEIYVKTEVDFPTMKTLGKNAGEAEKAAEAEEGFFTPNTKIDFLKVKVEPLFEETIDYETFSKRDFRAGQGKGLQGSG